MPVRAIKWKTSWNRPRRWYGKTGKYVQIEKHCLRNRNSVVYFPIFLPFTYPRRPFLLLSPSCYTMPPRGNEGYDFTPIVTHYLFLFTTILAVVSIFNLGLVSICCAQVAKTCVCLQAGWLTAFIGQCAATAKCTFWWSCLALEDL